MDPNQRQEPIKYLCGSCGRETPLDQQKQIECKHCHYPVLFKKRTRRIVEYQAR